MPPCTLGGLLIFANLALISCYHAETHRNTTSEERKERMKYIYSVRSISSNASRRSSVISGRSFKKGRSLPTGDLFSSDKPVLLDCGFTYDVAKEEYIYFTLVSDKRPCSHEFLGSYNEVCNVAVYCNGTIQLSPPSEVGCETEFLYLSDGTSGLMSGCGNFTFGKRPFIAHNGGKDLYVLVKGDHPETKCIAFCVEDYRPEAYGLKYPKRIPKNKAYSRWEEKTCTCGKLGRKEGVQSGRVVGGTNAMKFDYPWQAALVFPESRMAFCGGTLVNDRYVVTAAHCFPDPDPEGVQVLLHAHILDQNSLYPDDPSNEKIPGWTLPTETDESENSTRLNVTYIRVHPLYDSENSTFDYDVAIMKLAHPINLQNSELRTACLPNINEDLKYNDGDEMVVTGWGRPWEDAKSSSRILQKLAVPFVNPETCSKYTSPTKRHICNGYLEGGKDACSGDSGGPLVYKKHDHYLLAGVVSAGAGCARKDNLGVYTDVREVVQWIYLHTPGAISCRR